MSNLTVPSGTLTMLTLCFCVIVSACAPGYSFRRAPNSEEIAVIEAVKFANGLEASLWSNEAKFRSREEVFQHYRQGFNDDLARSQTEYSWPRGEQGLLPRDITTAVPERACVLRLTGDRATVAYETPESLIFFWDMERFTIQQLSRDGGRWIIDSSSEASQVSPGHRSIWRFRSGCE